MALATYSWSAPCFYYFHEDRFLLFKSSDESRHIREIHNDQRVSGAVYIETKDISRIQGLQFQGICRTASQNEEILYHTGFPVAREIKGVVYCIEITLAHLTDNTQGFGTKIIWKNI